jgi:phage-related protein
MLVISSAAIAEKNKVAQTGVWLILLEIQLPGETIYLAANNENISWNGQTWIAFDFEVDVIGEAGKGEIPSVAVKVCNITGEIMQRVEANNGVNKTPVILRVINTEVTGTTPELALSYKVKDSSDDEKWLTFRLSGGNCLTRRTPERRYLPDFCQVNYGSIRCGVTAATMASFPTCDGTRANCEERGNIKRFGGFPWIPKL